MWQKLLITEADSNIADQLLISAAVVALEQGKKLRVN
jgi:hypothetical protein